MIRPRALYLCYFGLREPLVQTQVLPYLRQLVQHGIAMSLLTFEPDPDETWTPDAIEEWRLRLRSEGIEWHMRAYHKRPTFLATLYDVLAGARHARAIARRDGITLFHGRSHVGAAIGALAKWGTDARLIFDFRGFLAEEYADNNNWRAGGLLYRLAKAVEPRLCAAADGFVVLTERVRQTLFPHGTGGRPLQVIPCCVDQERFAAAERSDRDAIRATLGLSDRLVFTYVGSLRPYLVRETAELLAEMRAREPKAFAMLLTQGPSERMVEELRSLGFSSDDYRVLHVAPDEVPRYLRAADIALAVMRPSFARRSMSPTKFAEYLAAGLPVIVSPGIGDLDSHIQEGRTGVLLDALDREAYAEAFSRVAELRRDRELSARCRSQVREQYDLRHVGAVRYRRLYAEVLGA